LAIAEYFILVVQADERPVSSLDYNFFKTPYKQKRLAFAKRFSNKS
jgi:hypothetical protein